MNNKKVIIVILVFLIGGLLVYSFAATPSDNSLDDKKTEYKDDENDNKPNDREDDGFILNDEQNKTLEDAQRELDEAKKTGLYTDDSLNLKQDLINSLKKASSNEEYEDIYKRLESALLVLKDENGESGNTVVVNKPNGTVNRKPSGSTTTGGNSGSNKNPNGTGTSGNNNSGSNGGGNTGGNHNGGSNNGGSTGENTGSNNGGNSGSNIPVTPTKPSINKSEATNLQNELNNAKNSGKYTDASINKKQELIDAAKNATTQSDYNKALENAKNYQLVEKIPSHIGVSNVTVSVKADGGNNNDVNITSEQNGTDIILSGTIITKGSLEDGRYRIGIQIVAPMILSDEALQNSKFKARDNLYGFTTYEQNGYARIINKNKTATERAIMALPVLPVRESHFANGAPLRIAIDWGNGDPMIYSIYFNEVNIISS